MTDDELAKLFSDLVLGPEDLTKDLQDAVNRAFLRDKIVTSIFRRSPILERLLEQRHER